MDFEETKAENWDDLDEFHKKFSPSIDFPNCFSEDTSSLKDDSKPNWVFRGQASAEWGLKTALDRSRGLLPNNESLPLVEEGLVREFQRRIRTTGTTSDLPERSNILEWLALMRHYGAPTRLLDWTYSFFIALYFAAESAEGDFAVWAIDAEWCHSRSIDILKLKPDCADVWGQICRDPYYQKLSTFRLLFLRDPAVPLVYLVNSFVLNQRSAVQKGVYLCPGDISRDFDANLEGLREEASNRSPVKKLKIKQHLQKKVLQRLHYMNIARDTLFPDLSGLAQSLTTKLAIPRVLIPRWRENIKSGPFEGWEDGLSVRSSEGSLKATT